MRLFLFAAVILLAFVTLASAGQDGLGPYWTSYWTSVSDATRFITLSFSTDPAYWEYEIVESAASSLIPTMIAGTMAIVALI